MLPAILSSFVIPLLPQDLQLFKIGILAFGSGLLMLTFSGTQIEGNPYTIMMTSGNYRKMLNEWYLYLTSKDKSSMQKTECTQLYYSRCLFHSWCMFTSLYQPVCKNVFDLDSNDHIYHFFFLLKFTMPRRRINKTSKQHVC